MPKDFDWRIIISSMCFKESYGIYVPNLRFKEFQGEWERKRLGEIATFSKGKGVAKSDIEESGITQCIRYGELYTHYGEVINEIKSKTNVNKSALVLSEANDVIIPASGETTIDIATASCVLKSGVALGGDLNIIKTNNNGIFLSYYLNSKKKTEIANLAQGISVVHLYSSQLATLALSLPKLEEQNKISNFLAKLDERITTQNKIIEELKVLKTTIAKRIFSQELRFKDDNGSDFPEWEVKKLGDLGVFFSGGTPLTTNKGYFNGDIPFIKSGEINSEKTEQYLSEEGLKNSSAKMVKTGDLIYALYGATSGEVGISKINGAINQAVLCIRTSINNIFLMNYLILQKESILKTYLQGGQGNLSAEIVKSLKVFVPNIEEQCSIANFLTSIDKKVNIETQLLQKLEKQKTFLLQNLFV